VGSVKLNNTSISLPDSLRVVGRNHKRGYNPHIGTQQMGWNCWCSLKDMRVLRRSISPYSLWHGLWIRL
jgi:hypothetical protein